MNNFLKSLMAIALAAFVFTGCVEDPCDTLECGLNGIPTESADGSTCACECINGFDGDACDVLATGKFIGNWDAADDCQAGYLNYQSLIDPFDGQQEQVEIFNFGNLGELLAWTANVSSDTIILPLSSDTNNDFQVLGMGIISTDRNTINWNYTITDNLGGADSCAGVWTRVQ